MHLGRRSGAAPELREALCNLLSQTKEAGPIIRSQRGGPITPVSMVNWFAKAYPQAFDDGKVYRRAALEQPGQLPRLMGRAPSTR
jgi:hypothetical protein